MTKDKDSDIGCLDLTRRVGQSYWIGEDVEVQVISIRNNKVKIRTVAPKSINIVRDELLERNEDEQP